ncbi:MAG: radical SAM protein [Candidatus Omnitrophota bacterium]
MRGLKEVILSITNRCNLHCKMCDIPLGSVGELPFEEWQKVIHDASRLGAQTVVFSGGEPLIRQDIFDLVKYAKNNNMSACITSNGTLLDEVKAVKLKECGVNVVNISIEGTKETHDSLRGAGSFDKAISALNYLRNNRIESTVASTVSRYNYADLPFILGVAKDCGATTVRLQPFNIIFLQNDSRMNEFFINEDEARKLTDIIRKFIDTAKEYRIATNPASYLSKISGYLNGKKLYPSSCGALWYSCPINPNGDVFPCWIEGANNNLVGNVARGGLYRLWLSEKRIKIVNSIIKRGCSGCLMSCYDEVFDGQLSKESVIKKAKKLSKVTDYKKVMNKVSQFFNGQVTNLKLRYRYYISYRGSLWRLFKRRATGIFNRAARANEKRRPDKEKILSEIVKAKARINKEVRTL